MAPSIRELRQAVTKKRKAARDGQPVERRAVAKIPRRNSTGRTEANKSDAGATKAVEPVRIKIAMKPDAGRADAGRSDTGRVRDVPTGGEVVSAPVRREKESTIEVGQEVGGSQKTPTPATLIDLSPERTVKTSSPLPHMAATEPGVAVISARGITAGLPPSAEMPKATESEAESSQSRGTNVDPSFASLLANHSRWAERALNESTVVEVQEFLKHQGRATFFREAAVAHLWALNTMIAMRDLWTLGDIALDHSREEMESLQAKTERAEMALEDVRSTLRGQSEILKSRLDKAEYALEVAQRQAAYELDNAQVAEEKLEAAESEINVLKDQLRSAVLERDTATEAARRTDAEITVLKTAVSKAREEAAEASKEAIEAKVKISEAENRATGAVEDFRKSKAFNKELAESTAFAYEAGFQDCKEKIQRTYDLEGIDGLEPDESPEDEDSSLGHS